MTNIIPLPLPKPANTAAADLSSIAQLLFTQLPALNLAKLVSDLGELLVRIPGNIVTLHWEQDAVAVFDMAGLRILVAWDDAPTPELAGCLTLSVGPALLPGAPLDYDRACARLVERVQRRARADEVRWQRIDAVADADLVDHLLTLLPKPATAPCVAARRVVKRAPDPQAVANDRPPALRPTDADSARVREALYGEMPQHMPERQSPQMRLAIHAMNATLITVWAPLGAAAMTYSLLKGEDLRFSARLLLLGGSILALSQGQLGTQFAALTGA